MKRLIVLSAVFMLLFYSCQKEDSSICTCESIKEGLLCKQAFYKNDKLIEYTTYHYNNGLLTDEKLYNNSNKEESHKEYTYNSKGQIDKITSYEGLKEVGYWKYTYNTNDSVDICSYYDSKDVITNYTSYTYDNLKRKSAIINYRESAISDYYTLFYAKSLLNPIGINHFSKDSSLLSYKTMEYFDNSFLRINYYDSLLTFSGYEVCQYNQENLLIAVNKYDEIKSITSQQTLDYTDTLLTRITIKYNVNDLSEYYENCYY